MIRRIALMMSLGLALAAPAFTHAQGSYFRVVSWNTRHMGWSGETDYAGYAAQAWRQFGSSSTSTNGCDAIFLQEVMNTTAISNFVSAMNSVSGVTWAHSTTAAIGRSSYKEHYSVVYRTDRVSLISSTTWSDSGDKFEREPQIVRLRDKTSNADYTFINWHTIFGTTSERDQEIRDIVAVFNSVQNSTSADQDVILLGDFNRPADHAAFSNLLSTSYVNPAVTWKVNDLTSINSSCAFASAYDHFFFQATYVSEFSNAGRDYIANMCNLYALSDHAPVWLRLYATSDTD
jgi:endonuclease/exonuclease/phosphatase family metal-dependent hydrolase